MKGKQDKVKIRRKFKFNRNNPFGQNRNKSATSFRQRYYYGGIIAFIRRYGIKSHRNLVVRETTYKFKRFY